MTHCHLKVIYLALSVTDRASDLTWIVGPSAFSALSRHDSVTIRARPQGCPGDTGTDGYVPTEEPAPHRVPV
ncbi:hypothetical protein GCM10029976_050490 [Kribbella albertanoniae]